MRLDPIIARLRAAGCVNAEAEAAFIGRNLADPERIEQAVVARTAGMPLEQAVGVAEFAGVTVDAAVGVFVPRRRSEVVVDAAVQARPDAEVVVDLGCGSGALAAALAARLPRAQVHAADVDPAATDVARVNGARHGFTVHEGSWWDALPDELRGRVDLAVGYLPHVPTARIERIHRDYLAHEPRLSVDGGPDGLDPLRAVLAGADDWLSDAGRFVTLLSVGQAQSSGGRVLWSDGEDAVVGFG